MNSIAQTFKKAASKTGKFPMIFALASIFIVNTASTCEWEHDDDDHHNGHSQNVSAISSAVNSGTWKVTYYYDTDSEQTSQFQSYTFTFANNGQLVATNGTADVNGTWSVTNSGSHSRHGDDDNSSSSVDFNIFFASPGNFAELTDDWDIVMFTSNRIELVDVSGGNGGTDILTFEKL